MDGFRFFPSGDRFPNPVSVIVLANHRPTVLPAHGLEVDHPAKRVQLLKMQEPPLASGRIDNSSLVGSVDPGGASLKHDFALIGAIDIPGAEDSLPATPDATFRDAQVV